MQLERMAVLHAVEERRNPFYKGECRKTAWATIALSRAFDASVEVGCTAETAM
jgi:hypothetical protein